MESLDLSSLFEDLEADHNIIHLQQYSGSTQGYLYEPRNEETELSSDESSSDDEQTDASDINVGDRVGNTNWCICGECSTMKTEVESKCCQEISAVESLTREKDILCITSHPGFEGNCTNQYVIETSFYEFLDSYGHIGDDEPIHEIYRYVAYRRFSRWVWHILGRGNRRVIPSCAVKKIREAWPSENYTGFQYKRHY